MLSLSNLTPAQLQLGMTVASKLGVSMPMLAVVTQALNDKSVFNEDGTLNDERVQAYGNQLITLMDQKPETKFTHNHAAGIGCPSCGYWITV